MLAEEIDTEKRTHFQPINELRHAFDHLMRIFAAKLEINKPEEVEEYTKTNFEKVIGHVYRSVYDSLDWISINLRVKIGTELEGFSTEAIQAVLPDYYSEIRPYVEEANEKISRLRASKDVVNINEGGDIQDYLEIVKTLRRYHKQILKAKPALIEYQKKHEKEKNTGLLKNLAIGILILFLGWILGKVI